MTPNTIRDLIFSYLRTIVPNVVAGAVTWIGRKTGIIIDDATQGQLLLVAYAAVFAAYYGIVRLLETYVSAKFSILLGDPRTGGTAPVYPDKTETTFVPAANTNEPGGDL